MKSKEITEIIHTEFVLADQEADLLTSKLCFGNKNVFERIKNKVKSIIVIILKKIGLFE